MNRSNDDVLEPILVACAVQTDVSAVELGSDVLEFAPKSIEALAWKPQKVKIPSIQYCTEETYMHQQRKKIRGNRCRTCSLTTSHRETKGRCWAS